MRIQMQQGQQQQRRNEAILQAEASARAGPVIAAAASSNSAPMQAKLEDVQRRHEKALAAAGVSDGSIGAGGKNGGNSGCAIMSAKRKTIPSSTTHNEKQRPLSLTTTPYGFASPEATSDAAVSLISLSNSKAKVPAASDAATNNHLPAEAVNCLKAWVSSSDHIAHPYPTDEEKSKLLAETGLSVTQLNSWLMNYRKRHWKNAVGFGTHSSPPSDRKRNGGSGSNAKASPSTAAVPPVPPPPLSPEAAIASPDRDLVITPRPVDESGTLDIHAYHRGRAGCEPRCSQSGNLLCDVTPNDTGQMFALKEKAEEGKKFVVRINISFPLCDVEDLEDAEESGKGDKQKVDESDGNANHALQRLASLEEERGGVLAVSTASKGVRSSRSSSRQQLPRTDSMVSQQSFTNNQETNIPHFHDSVEWDLSSPDTPTAMSYAISIANDFGLSFGQTLDLATSIQNQIDAFIRDENLIRPLPIAAKDPHGVQRAAGTTIALLPMLYGGAHSGGGGSVQLTTQMKKGNLSRSGSRVGGQSRGGGRAYDRPRGPVKKSSSKYEVVPAHLLPSYETAENKYKIGLEFRREVVNRAKAELQRDMVKKAEGDSAPVGLLKVVKDEVCHICHHRKSIGVRFFCEGNNHVYCDYHCSTRLGFSAKDAIGGTKTLDFCPVCCLTCLCSKCARKLDEVAGHFMRQCQNQGVTDNPPECNIDSVLELCTGMQRVSTVPKTPAPSKSPNRTKPQKKKAKKLPDPVVVVEDAASLGLTRAHRRHPQESSKRQAKSESSPRAKKVAKPPVSEFPIETCGGFDLDPSLDYDSRTVYLPEGGSYVRKDDPMPQPKIDEVQLFGAETGVVEDGSVDYCQACTKGGSLICCDRCPRSFHSGCLPHGLTEDQIPDSDWECHLCVRDSSPQPNNEITGESHVGLIAASYTDMQHCDLFTEKLLTLAKIHELLLFLCTFDFGYMFKNPVDTKQVPDYLRIVKKPMDLSTICANIVTGKYAKNAKKELTRDNAPASQVAGRVLDHVALSALQDLELMYHNCFTYNIRGTAIYRMAEVQRRKARMIIDRSIEQHMSEDAMRQLDDYALHLKQAREAGRSKSGPKKVSLNSRNKILVPFVKGRSGRIVAVFDPSTNMIVKQYTTLRAAVQAALFIAQLGYASEVPATDHCIKSLVRKSGHDPSLVLFQYRWLYLDDLRSGRVVVVPPWTNDEEFRSSGNSNPDADTTENSSSPKKDCGTSPPAEQEEMEDEAISWIRREGESGGPIFYNSIDGAYDSLVKDKILAKCTILSREAFVKALYSVAPGEDIVTMGSRWCRFKHSDESNVSSGNSTVPGASKAQQEQVRKQEHSKVGDVAASSGTNGAAGRSGNSNNIMPHPGVATVLSLGGETFFETSMESALTECAIVKTDRMSGAVMGAFETFDSAFKDWKTVREGALCSSGIDPSSLDIFKRDYVYGDKNIEGIEWKTMKPLDARWKKRPREYYESGGSDPLRSSAKKPRQEKRQ